MKTRTRGARQRGFTLIELMVAMVVSSLLVGMILAIFLRMSVAYRSQQQVAGLQQVLASARQLIESDAKHAGLGMTNGIKLVTDATLRFMPVGITNNTTAPDTIRFMYADTTVQAAYVSGGYPTVVVDSSNFFKVDDLVVLSNADTTQPNPDDAAGATVTTHLACLLKVEAIPSTTQLTFYQASPFGSAVNAHCPALTGNKTMIYKLVARAYRIDPDPGRADLGALQVSPTGALFNTTDFQDLAYGFTDLQVATQFYDGDGVDTGDADADPKREWYSSTDQTNETAAALDGVNRPAPLQMTISLVARTDRDVEGVATTTTPLLTVTANTTNNTIGDRDAIDLTTTTDPSMLGERIYRYITFSVDFRNIGVGR